MKFIKEGNEGAKNIILVSGMGMDCQKSLGALASLLKDEYHINYLILDGAFGEGNFDSISSQAKKAVELIKKEYNGRIDYAFGISMGANILIKILEIKPDIFEKVVLDAPFLVKFNKLICKTMSKMYANKIKKLLDTEEYNKLNEFIGEKLGPIYKERNIDFISIIDKNLSEKSIENQAYHSYTMDLLSGLKHVKAKILFVCGDREKFALQSFDILKKYIQNIRLIKFKNHDHGTKLKLELDSYKELICSFFNS